MLPEKKTKVLHLSHRNAVDLTKQKVSLLKNGKGHVKKTADGQDQPMKKDTGLHKKRAFGEVITDSN